MRLLTLSVRCVTVVPAVASRPPHFGSRGRTGTAITLFQLRRVPYRGWQARDMMAPTLLQPRDSRSESSRKTSAWSRPLPDDLLKDAQRRLHILALLMAFVFFAANFGWLAIGWADHLAHLLERAIRWAPGVISISLALAVAAVTKYSKLPAATVLNLGLVFEVVISFGIATAEYSEFYAPMQRSPGDYQGVGLSWVAPWVLVYAMVVPTPPRKALLAMIASVSAVPIVLALTIRFGPGAIMPVGGEFAFAFALQYGLVVLMGFVGARVVYKMGADVGRARELGSYQLIDRIGRGGMGEVWKAEHRMLARTAAIKLIRPDALGGEADARQIAVARFEREAQTTAALRSPHAVELYDFGVADTGALYYVMELLQGFDAQVLVEKFGPLPAERVVYLLTQVCDSLGEAHAAGLVHRDIKPSNIHVCRYGRKFDFVKVLDFGLVKLRHDVGDEKTMAQLTVANVITGTPAFMAPEQVLGEAASDGRTDLYAVGCVAFWLLTGQTVFQGSTVMDMLTQHARDEPPPPSQCSELPIPPALDEVILRCLAKRPQDRPQSADELAQALQIACDARAWTEAQGREWWERRLEEA